MWHLRDRSYISIDGPVFVQELSWIITMSIDFIIHRTLAHCPTFKQNTRCNINIYIYIYMQLNKCKNTKLWCRCINKLTWRSTLIPTLTNSRGLYFQLCWRTIITRLTSIETDIWRGRVRYTIIIVFLTKENDKVVRDWKAPPLLVCRVCKRVFLILAVYMHPIKCAYTAHVLSFLSSEFVWMSQYTWRSTKWFE